MFSKSLKKALLLGAGLLFIGGCGNNSSTTSDSKKEANSSDKSQLTVYTNSLDDKKEAWLKEKAGDAGYELQIVSAGAGDIFNRVMAEKGDPQADVIIGLDEGLMSQVKDADLLVDFKPEWASDIPEDLKVGGESFYPWAEQRIFAYYDKEKVKEAPASLEDLSKIEAFKGKYAVPRQMAGSTDQKIVFSILMQYLDPKGELGVSKEGWQAAKDFFANGYIPTEGQDRNGIFADGTVLATYHFSGGVPNLEKEFGFTATPINPSYGVFSMNEQVAVVKKADTSKQDKAIAFATWWGSPEIQKEWVKDFGTVPTLNSIQDAVDPRIHEIMEQTSRMKIDWNLYNQYADEWVQKIELDIIPVK